jgi:TPR repeat protein
VTDKADSDSPTVRQSGRGLADRDVDRLRAAINDDASADLIDARFELVGEAGSGGMGIVYEAIDRLRTPSGSAARPNEAGTCQDRVAIKVITGLPSSNERARFAAEAAALGQLDHPAIVDYVAHGATEHGEPYLAMEWLVGESLSARLARGPLTIAETLVMGERIADALDHAHEHGIVHRDLKPSNIFLVDGKVEAAHLIDFGVAKMPDREPLTNTGQMIGTPGYMAPEQVRGEKRINPSADLFAFGCVLYKALTGRDAFAGNEVMEVLAKLLLEHPEPVDQIVEGVPPRLAHLIGSLLSKEAAQRLGDAAIARDELRAIREAMFAQDTDALELKPASVPAPTAAPTLQVTLRKRRRTWVWVAAATAIAIGAGAFAISLKRAPTCNDDVRTGCQTLCDDDNADACYLLARTLHKNDAGIPEDHEAARTADRKACKLGNNAGCVGAARSLLDTAKRFPSGDTRRQSRETEAVGLLQGACDRDFFEACRRLGFAYSLGFGQLPADPPRAFALVERACDGNDDTACGVLVDMIADPNNGATDAMRKRAREVRAAACKRGIACAP